MNVTSSLVISVVLFGVYASCARSDPSDDFAIALNHLVDIEPKIAKQLDKSVAVEDIAEALKTYAEVWQQLVDAAPKDKMTDTPPLLAAIERFKKNAGQRKALLGAVVNAETKYSTSPTILDASKKIRELSTMMKYVR